MSHWKLSTRVWAIVGSGWAVALSAAGFLLLRLEATAQAYDRLFAAEVRQQKLVRELQVGFKKQVQE